MTVCQHGLNQLEFGNCLSKLFALHGVTETVIDESFCDANTDSTDMQSTLVQNLHRGFKSHIFLAAHHVFCGYGYVVKHDVTDIGTLLTHFTIGLAQLNAIRASIDEKCGNASGATFVRIRPGKNRQQCGFGRIRNIAFGAIDYVVVAITLCRGLNRGSIGPGIRFSETKRTDNFSRCHTRQIALLLFVCAIDNQCL